MQIYSEVPPEEIGKQPQKPKRLFDDEGRYLGAHRPGVTFETCWNSERHGGDGCRACDLEALAWRRAHRVTV